MKKKATCDNCQEPTVGFVEDKTMITGWCDQAPTPRPFRWGLTCACGLRRQNAGTQTPPVPITGGGKAWPIFDRHGRRLHVGDRIRAQVCTGRYGQTSIVEVTLTEPHWQYCQLNVNANGKDVLIAARYDFKDDVLRCEYEHHDFEHGHKQWAEVIPATKEQTR